MAVLLDQHTVTLICVCASVFQFFLFLFFTLCVLPVYLQAWHVFTPDLAVLVHYKWVCFCWWQSIRRDLEADTCDIVKVKGFCQYQDCRKPNNRTHCELYRSLKQAMCVALSSWCLLKAIDPNLSIGILYWGRGKKVTFIWWDISTS